MSDYEGRIKFFESLYDSYSASFWGELHQSLHNTEVCEEVLLNAFAEIWRTLPQIKPGENLFAWCFRIVRKEAEKKKVELLLKEIFACQHLEVTE